MTKIEFIKYILEHGEKSIQELADLSGVSRNNFYHWIGNKSIPRHATINKLANSIGLNIVWINDETLQITSDAIQKTDNKENEIVDLQNIIQLQKKTIELLQKKLMNSNVSDIKLKHEPIPAHFFIQGYWSSDKYHSIEEIEGNIAMLGYTPNKIKSMESDKWLALFHPDDRRQMQKLVKSYFADVNSKSTTFESRFKVHRRLLGLDGNYHHFRVLLYRYNHGYYDAYYYYLYKITKPEKHAVDIGLKQTMPN